MNRIPEPPCYERSDIRRYLPALYPHNEKEIMEETKELDHVWPTWSAEKRKVVEELMFTAMRHFDTRFVAMSFFDEEFELVKAENGYNSKFIFRDVSFAAHALLSTEVFAIPDTKKV